MESSYLSPLLRPDLIAMIEAGDSPGVLAFFQSLHPAVTAVLLEELPPQAVRPIVAARINASRVFSGRVIMVYPLGY